MNKNYARLVVIGQVMEEKYDPSSHTAAEEVFDTIGDIEEKLSYIKELPWLSDAGVMLVRKMMGDIDLLGKEVEKSKSTSRDTFIPSGEENDTY